MHTILVAEDDTYLRDAYITILSAAGYTVISAENGKVALQHIKKAAPDVLLLDMLMPVMSGLELLEHLSQENIFPASKVIAFTNLSDKHTLDALTTYGVAKYLLKSSVMPAQLVEAVQETATEGQTV